LSRPSSSFLPLFPLFSFFLLTIDAHRIIRTAARHRQFSSVLKDPLFLFFLPLLSSATHSGQVARGRRPQSKSDRCEPERKSSPFFSSSFPAPHFATLAGFPPNIFSGRLGSSFLSFFFPSKVHHGASSSSQACPQGFAVVRAGLFRPPFSPPSLSEFLSPRKAKPFRHDTSATNSSLPLPPPFLPTSKSWCAGTHHRWRSYTTLRPRLKFFPSSLPFPLCATEMDAIAPIPPLPQTPICASIGNHQRAVHCKTMAWCPSPLFFFSPSFFLFRCLRRPEREVHTHRYSGTARG